MFRMLRGTVIGEGWGQHPFSTCLRRHEVARAQSRRGGKGAKRQTPQKKGGQIPGSSLGPRSKTPRFLREPRQKGRHFSATLFVLVLAPGRGFRLELGGLGLGLGLGVGLGWVV